MADRRKKESGTRSTVIPLTGRREIKVYAGKRISEAFETIGKLTVYEGVRMSQLIEAVYDQGHKDGAKTTIDAYRSAQTAIENAIPHRAPGRPRLTKKR